jgi:imidazole glycerol-phosphate synthase subunit HisH
MKVTIIDYGMGNVKSIIGALKYLKVNEIKLSNKPKDIFTADKLILPGVGSFPVAMKNIQKLGLDKHLYEAIKIDKKPVLGICLGMQILCNNSLEDGSHNGLGFVNAEVIKFKNNFLKVPHVGFNQVEFNNNSILYKGLSHLSDFYFVHSYKVLSDQDICQSTCFYGDNFLASFEIDNIFGVQFHPELSQKNGLTLLDNYISYY